MSDTDKLYRNLQEHLDKQTLGFPRTDSGSDIRLLRELFSPDQAEIAMLLTYKFETLEQIHERAKEYGKSLEETNGLLHETAARGVIGYRKKDGVEQYRNIPYVVGMLEGVALNATPELMSAHVEYSNDGLFWRDFLKTKVPQMRTIPISKSIVPEHHIGTYDEIKEIIRNTDDPIVIISCMCRAGKKAAGDPCRQTDREETCMVFRDSAKALAESGALGRQISKDEAISIIEKNQEDGLVLQPSNSQNPDFICSCCGCCCGILQLHKKVPNPVGFWATNFHAEIDLDLCMGCGTCVDRCQTAALKLDEEKTVSVVDLARCLGCGLCVDSCPEEAIKLEKNEKEVIPPSTAEEMTEVIMTGKL